MADRLAHADPRAAAQVLAICRLLADNLDELSEGLFGTINDAIPELHGDPAFLDLMRSSIRGNLETLVHTLRMGIPVAAVVAPPQAVEYARRMAQRGISSNAMLRAYRLGQERILTWVFAELRRSEADPRVAFGAGELMTTLTFGYVDRVCEQLVGLYEEERERWLASRNTVRAATLADLIDGRPVEVATAESALGYRLRQHHLGLVLWRTDDPAADHDAHQFENLVSLAGQALGSTGKPLFVQRDLVTAWGWIPLEHDLAGSELLDVLSSGLGAALCGRLQLAVGVPATGPEGFRRSHHDALRAQEVALLGADPEHQVYSYADAGVRAAALLAADLAGTRRLVAEALGDLAADDPGAARLRETLRVFLETRNSYSATAARVHLHRNTVKYRVDKAIAARGRPLDTDRLDLELALTACHWLGSHVLSPSA